MCFNFEKSNKPTQKPVNRFLQDGASAGIRSLQIPIIIKLCQTPENGLQLNNTRKMPAKCLLILSVEMNFIFFLFTDGRIDNVS